eukprot:gene1707-3306_t
MARNEEKAASLFNKWTTFKKDFHADANKRRPLLSTDCQSLPDAEKWRRELVREFTKKISAIQNASLGEHRIRELNDEINKISRQKHYWEIRIRELGGSDYTKGRSHFYDVEGKELPGAPHYKYYGAAKELPGVRELFAEMENTNENQRQKRSRADLYKFITPDYYGYRDDDDGVLVPLEDEREKQLIEEAEKEFISKRRKLEEDVRRSGGVYGATELAELEDNDNDDSDEYAVLLAQGLDTSTSNNQLQQPSAMTDVTMKAHVFVPSQEDITAEVTERKRQGLLEKYS